jgi:hypothetical protein
MDFAYIDEIHTHLPKTGPGPGFGGTTELRVT